WIDGTTRCVPEAEDAIWSDAACTTAIGRGILITKPKYFIGHDLVEGSAVASHVYAALDPIPAPGEYYELHDGTCTGPFSTPSEDVYYQLGGEVDTVALDESVIGDGRLALRVRTSNDGSITPIGIFDRELAVDCEPVEDATGGTYCEPVYASTASLFADARCEQPAVGFVTVPSPQPLVARREQNGDCPTYHRLGAELTTPVYQRQGNACVVAGVPLPHVFPLVEEAVLAPVDRAVEPSSRRLRRIIASADGLVAYSSRLVDTAIRGDCARYPVGDIERCLPPTTIFVETLYEAGCTQRMRVASVPTRSCHPPAFVLSATDPPTVAALGDVTTQATYRLESTGACSPYTPPRDRELRTLGPPLPDDTFLAARPFGER
ncbi:MAG TPA: hypothetical protein VMZ53_31885, partial [Kofleriaceae bacterium]|nr:hypothetical protein [Kofleriaceae bacterium]